MLRRLLPLVALVAVATGCAGLVEVTPVGSVDLQPPEETSLVAAADGSVLAELHAEQDRDLVPLERIPQALRDAVVAVEDTRFYSHGGVDARAVARAFVQNARHGRVVEGGSTITQQLAKNTGVGTEQTLDRKLTEASVALQLERQLSKDEILEHYLNTVYFGNGAYGVQTAARRYFDTDVDDLDLPQSALLAGLVKAPTTYDPYVDPDAAAARRDLVLAVMVREGLVPDAEAAAAKQQQLDLAPPRGQQPWEAPYFVAHVLKLLQHDPAFEVLGADPVERASAVFRQGLHVETTLDPDWQDAAESAVAETLTHPDDPRAAFVAIDPGTGDVKALVGGRDYDDVDDPYARFNLATDGARQTGSTFKQLVLATALAQGHTLDEVWEGGSEVTIPLPGQQEPWVVRNYGGQETGDLTLRDATAYSVNVVYARLMETVGPQAVVDTARAAGVTRPLAPYESLALGAQDVSPLEMAGVQATLAAGGVHREPTAVTRITARDGSVIYERPEPEGRRALDEAVAWLTTTALEGVIDYGTGQRADLQRPMAGKTGTTQDSADAWFVGYTPDVAAAVWIGFPEGRIPMTPPRTRVPVEGGNWPAELFARFGLRALADVPASEFPVPDVHLTTVEVDTTRNCLPNPYTPPEVVAERGYLTGTEPTEQCREPTGPPTTDVPEAAGLPLEAAIRLFNGAGFTVEERLEYSVRLPPGYVVRQSPEAGADQTLDDGYVVTIWVSSADRTPVTVPDVLNAPVDEAREVLVDAGFVVEVESTCPDGSSDCTGARERPGAVWEQAPDAGQQVPVHSVVVLRAYPSP